MHTAQSAAAKWASRLAPAFRLICAGQLFLSVIFLSPRTSAQPASQSGSAIAELAKQAESDLHNTKPELAMEASRKILALDPNNINAHSNLGLAEYLQGRFASAAVEFNAALRLKPDIWNDAALGGLSEAKTGEISLPGPPRQPEDRQEVCLRLVGRSWCCARLL